MTFKEFYTKINAGSCYCLDFDDVSSVLMMYPASLVAIADGEFSHFERMNLLSALKEAASGNEFKMCEMYHLLCNLMLLDEGEKTELLNTIKEEIAERAELKLIILQLMLSTAESEDGISDVEKYAIDNLKSILSI